ncbi:chorismate synthase [Sporolactobacillus laevolacticus]|uniref:chorismate synthase n=1 Tax=Sporolactobacillus laevolacticus TaxID=33018 RepID=UPI0025B59D71|nr:chorismate synthase [Sporolactobacillus laevolacticus]MDN3953566.1 chorismate synthase [Sporolactobacillus laevolacticus]
MSSCWGSQIKLSIFGESHGTAIGGVIDGLPSGVAVDFEAIAFQMKRRAPGQNRWSTQRHEDDSWEVLSGLFEGRTTGTPLAFLIRNKDQKSKAYANLNIVPRPGHADYTAQAHYHGFQDYRGGGHFSGRLTAPLVFAGAIARQILENKGIHVGAHIRSIGPVDDERFDPIKVTADQFEAIAQKNFPVITDESGEQMKEIIEAARMDRDSVGGIIEAAVIGTPSGVGAPIFDALESSIASMLFAVPAVKGVSFGDGFDLAAMRGSQANDAYDKMDDDGRLVTLSNHNGGILGGITNGMPIVLNVVIKPTASISKPQQSVNMQNGEKTELIVKGRHDPCIVPRAVPVIEAAIAFSLLDAYYLYQGLEHV